MRSLPKLSILIGLLVLVGGFTAQRLLSAGGPATGRGLPAGVAPSGEVRGLLAAVPFEVETPFENSWRSDRPLVRRGWLVALAVDPALVRITQLEQPVLCADAEILMRYNHGEVSGCVVALLPTRDDPTTRDARAALGRTVFHFAAPELPERLDGLKLRQELDASRRDGARSLAPAVVDAARATGGATIVVKERHELDRLAAEWIRRWAPEDQAKADELSVPVGQ